MAVSVVVLVGLVLVVDAAVWHARFGAALGRAAPPAARAARYPSVTVIRPVRGADVGQLENFRAALDHGYPGWVETLFVFDSERDPGVANARAAIAAHPGAGEARVVIVGAPPPGWTGKLNAMARGLELARGELIAFGDSDSRPDRDVLRVLVEALLAADDIGATFAPVVVPDRLQTGGDVGYALLLNALYGPAAARATGDSGELPFIMGQLMVFRRPALGAIGGVACAEGQLVDDMYLGSRLHAAGYRNVMVTHPLQIRTGGLSFGAFFAVYRRWLLFGRNGLGIRFTWPLWLRGAAFWGALGLTATAVAAGAPLAAAPALTALAAQGWSTGRLHRRHGGAPVPLRHAWMLWSLFLLAPLVFASMARRRVRWRGRTYTLRSGARLRPLATADYER